MLGVGISVLNLSRALEALAEAVQTRTKGYVCVTGVHGVCEAQDDVAFKSILNRAFLVTPDGMPMVWAGKLAGWSEMDRVYGPDLMLLVMQESVKRGWTHFFYGGANGAAEELKQKLTSRFPGLQVVGTYEPPFRPLTEDEEVALKAQVSASQPHFFWVGLSTPKQERFMSSYLQKLDTVVMLGVGAAFDFHSGRISQAPRWMQRSGLEWFYRVCSEPKRLAKRYAKNNPRFVFWFLLQKLGLKKFELERGSAGQ